jgi:pimeloyl-ACP methyl ester carboxylesterase
VSVAAGGFATPAAVAFAQTNPGAVDSLLLSNPTPPGESSLANPTLYLSRIFDAIVARCEEDESCKLHYPDLPGEFARQVAQFTKAPLPILTNPLTEGDPGVWVLLDGRRMGAALATALKASGEIAIVPSAISAPRASTGLLAAAAINDDLRFYAGHGALAGAALSYFCSYDARPNRTAEVTEAALARFAGANDPSLQSMCEVWNVPPVFDQLSEPLIGDLPVLFMEGGLSVAGVNGWSDQMAANLPNSTVIHLPTLSEDLSYVQPACVRKIRQAFLANPRAKHRVASCEAASPPIQFVGA